MNYCALEDAYQEIGGAPSPGCAMDTATKAARKEERRKARRCKGPAATYLNIQEQDSEHKADVPAMNHTIGLKEHAPVTEEPFESFTYRHHKEKKDSEQNQFPVSSPEYDKDPLHDYVVNEQRAQVMTVPVVTEHFSTKKKFFGADPDGDAFADYVPDQDNYRLQPDFLTAFEHAGVAKAGSASKIRSGMGAKMPPPSANMYWKPLTPSGAQTSFMENNVQHKYYPDAKHGGISNAEIMKKIDKIFARLDDLNAASSPEQIHSELLMFISSGIFVLFMMDLLVKKGSTLRF